MGCLVTQAEAKTRCEEWRRAGLRLVFTNGHFDLLHLGHVDYLQRARELGDRLIVGLNGDTSTRRLKGPHRPIVPASERGWILAALACVDLVVIFEETTAQLLVSLLCPAVYVKGGDWAPEGNVEGRIPPEASVVTSYGGQVAYLPYLPDHSTSRIIATILERYGRCSGRTDVE